MEWRVEHHEREYSVITHTLDHWVGSKGQIFFFSESGHAAYH